MSVSAPSPEAVPPGWKVPGARAFAALSRRVRALILGSFTFVVLLALLLLLPVPYVLMSPGPTFDTLATYDNGGRVEPIIAIDGTQAKKVTGHLNMLTVNVSTASISAFQALAGWLRSDEVVVPTAAIYPPGQSQDAVAAENSAEFAGSQQNATQVALCKLGYPKGFGVLQVSAKGPSAGRLKPGDRLESIDGHATKTFASLSALLKAEKPGHTVTVAIMRADKPMTVTVKLGKPAKDAAGTIMGISLPQTTACLAPFTVDIGLGNEIGGPSAGMMFTLGIIEKLGKADITHGRFVAGTGTVDLTGAVGPIGGIQLKMIAARRAGATIFLAPRGNCGEVRGSIPSGLTVYSVSTIDQALAALQASAAGKINIPQC